MYHLIVLLVMLGQRAVAEPADIARAAKIIQYAEERLRNKTGLRIELSSRDPAQSAASPPDVPATKQPATKPAATTAAGTSAPIKVGLPESEYLRQVVEPWFTVCESKVPRTLTDVVHRILRKGDGKAHRMLRGTPNGDDHSVYTKFGSGISPAPSRLVVLSESLQEVQRPQLYRVSRLRSSSTPHRVVLCEVMSAFSPLNVEEMECTGVLGKLSDTSSVTLNVVDPGYVLTMIRVCSCSAMRVKRWTWTSFFNVKERLEDRWRIPPDPKECESHCEPIFAGEVTSAVRGSVPDYCYAWMSTCEVQGDVYQVSLGTAKFHRFLNQIRAPFIVDDPCTPSAPCKGSGDSLVLAKIEEDNPRFTTMNGELTPRYNWDTHKVYQVHLPGVTTSILDASCGFLHGGYVYYQLMSGRIVSVSVGTLQFGDKVKPPICTEWKGPYMPFVLPDSQVASTSEQLRQDLLHCQTRKEVVLNALATKRLPSITLFEGLGYKGSESYGLVSRKGLLYAAPCPSVEYTDLEHVEGNIWMVVNNGREVGCLDGGLNFAVKSGCVVNPNASVSILLGEWKVISDRDGKLLAEPIPKAGWGSIPALENISAAFGDYLASLEQPPLWDDGNGPIIIPTSNSTGDPVIHSGASSLWSSMSLASKITAILMPLLSLAVVVGIIMCCRR
ncbi:glycoprotein [Fox fecal rhabdovirus]|uniref:Glycoprotein n=1 Tax=Fox fecal rhabdovirus TaxID=1504569 RepID=A0A060DAU5_9RHAB|nr:glycoprotein [Fox fecal rhabdovirus]AIB06808.1 glycoprotein [Fox fecal rhabdovirus]